MKLNPRVLSTAAVVALSCAVSAAAYYYKSRSLELNEVMVFCKLQFNAFNYFDKLVSFIEAAKQSVNVCMPGIHNPAIQHRLVNLLKTKDVKVRIIIDRTGYKDSTEFFIKELVEAGAEVRCKTSEPGFSMQHKFCLVDDKVLMTGTLNWGNDLSFDNWNYVYITSKDQLVEPVKREFYQIWDMSSSIDSVLDVSESDADTIPIGNTDEITNKTGDVGMLSTIIEMEHQTNPEIFVPTLTTCLSFS